MAQDDANSISEDASPNRVTGNMLFNDSDPNDDVVAVANAGTFTLSYGTLVLNADASDSYTVDNGNPEVNALNDSAWPTRSPTAPPTAPAERTRQP